MEVVTTVQVRSDGFRIERDSAESSAFGLHCIVDSVTVITIKRDGKEGGHGFPRIPEKKVILYFNSLSL